MTPEGTNGYVLVAPASQSAALDTLVEPLVPRESGPIVKVTAQPGTATLSDLQWEWRAEKQKADELASTRTAGEKWATAITSLTGVFTVVVLIKGPEDITAVKGTVPDWLPDSPPDGTWMVIFLVVALVLTCLGFILANHWNRTRGALWLGALISAVLAAFAVAQGLVLWETIVISSLGVAVAFASISILAGARAAYGPLAPDPAGSGWLLRSQQRREVRRSRSWLIAAIYPAVCAVAFIALAIAITWVRTPDAPAPGKLLVIREDGGPICGQLESRKENALLVRRAKQESADEIPRERIRAVTSVATCPGD